MAENQDFLELLKQYPRAIVHLRSQVRKQRFGAVLGAGISNDFGAPSWDNLIRDIAADPAVNATELAERQEFKKMTAPYKSEVLFQKFQAAYIKTLENLTSTELQNSITAEWLKICQKYLYKSPSFEITEQLPKHPYMDALIPLVQGSALTVNFNFDDYLERALVMRKRAIDKGNRGFEAVTDPWPQFRRTDCVIYHPHGYVPAGLMEKAVDRFVFSEASYSKQYVGARGHDTSFLLAHFARNTCLMIGCSLEAELRNVLMRGSEINPGNFHYYVHWLPSKDSLTKEECTLISETNFKVYNLNTLFLTSAEINALLNLINPDVVSEQKIKDFAARVQTPIRYTFYMTGSLGVGKSTSTNQLRNLTVLDEWLEPRLEILGKPWDTLTPEQKDRADTWIADQFAKKNDSLRGEENVVISVVDRPPLDPLVFTPENERAKKARFLSDKICPDNAYGIESGVVILLLGNPSELSARVRATGRQDYTAQKLEKMQNDMKELYGSMQGTVTIDTQFMDISQLTKRIAEIIHREPYEPANLTGKLQSYIEIESETA